MTTPVYIVFGSNGEYSNYTKWHVCAYLSKESAEAKVKEMSGAIGKFKRFYQRWSDAGFTEAMCHLYGPCLAEARETDPQFRDYDIEGTEYAIMTVDLMDLPGQGG